jgi:predicted neuraminidase
MSKRVVLFLIAVTVLLYAYSFWVHAPRGASGGQEPFLRNPAARGADDVPGPPKTFNYEEFISPPSSIQVHVASLTELKDGTLAAVWYGGKYEGSKDTFIFLTTHAPGKDNSWTEPRGIVGRTSATKELKRYIKKVGNPLIFSDAEDRLWLLFVTVSVGGWSGSSLNVKISEDRGETWSPAQRLTLSPFFNISELARNNPVPLEGGGFAIPIYHEFIGTFSEMLRLRLIKNFAGCRGAPRRGDPTILKGDNQKKLNKSFVGSVTTGDSFTKEPLIGWVRRTPAGGKKKSKEYYAFQYHKSRMTWGRCFIQPSVVVQGDHKAAAFYRGHFNNRKVTVAISEDTGVSWSEPVPLDLPNPGSGLNALRLSENRILLAYNDNKYNRENLSLAVLDENGRNPRRVTALENTPGEEFSYPYMLRTRDGNIHLVYTWHRKRIKHVVFNEAWLETCLKAASQVEVKAGVEREEE